MPNRVLGGTSDTGERAGENKDNDDVEVGIIRWNGEDLIDKLDVIVLKKLEDVCER